IEVMAAGKAAIASRVGGVPELARHGREALLVEPKDVAGLARAMSRLAADAPLRRRLERCALRRARRFEWSSVAASYRGLYQRIVDKAAATVSAATRRRNRRSSSRIGPPKRFRSNA